MKKISYIFMGMVGMFFLVSGVEAKEAPTFTTTFDIETDGSVGKVTATAKNAKTTCDGTGVKNGAMYVYLDSDVLFEPTNIVGKYKNYNEETGNFDTENAHCSYDGTIHAVKCDFGRTVTTPALKAYSDCKDEMVVTFDTEICEGEDDCSVKVSVKGEAIDYNNGTPITISNGTKTLSEQAFACKESSSFSEVVSDGAGYDNYDNYEENPDTFDPISKDTLICLGSLILGVVLVSKKKRMA